MSTEITMGIQELLGYVNDATHITVVDFYADWCGPCQRAKPQYHLLAEQFHAKRAKFFAVNADRQSSCMSHFNVTGLPTFAVFHAGKELLRTHSVTDINSNLDRFLRLVQGPTGGDNQRAATSMGFGGAGQRLGSGFSVPVAHKTTAKMIDLSKLASSSDVSQEAVLVAAESVRSQMMSDRAGEPLGLSLLPYLCCSVGRQGGQGLEAFLTSLRHLDRTRGDAAHRGVAEAVVNNILRFILQMALALTWNERESIEMLFTMMQSLALSSAAQEIMVSSPYFFNTLTIRNGLELEYQTVLGALFGVAPYCRLALSMVPPHLMTPPQQLEYVTLTHLFNKDNESQHDAKVRELQHTVDSVGLHTNELTKTLLRSKITREATMVYFAEALRLNEGHQKTVTRDLPLSSIYFMTQIQIVLLNAAKPVFDGLENTVASERIPSSYLLDDDPEEGGALVTFPKDVERVCFFDSEHPLPAVPTRLPPPVSTSPVASTTGIVATSSSGTSPFVAYKPSIHLFYLAARVTTVIVVPLLDSHRQMERQAAHQRENSSPGAEREYLVVNALYRIREALLGSSAQSRLRLNFCNGLSNWLLSVMEADPQTGELPKKPPLAWEYLPQELVDSAVKATQLAQMSDVYTPHLHGLLLLLMGNTTYFPKPHTHVFSYLLTRLLRDPVASEALQRHSWFSKNIVRSCMNCYIAVEKATYERSHVRFDLSLCLKQFLQSESLSSAVREEMSNPNNTSLERFSHMAVAELNEAVDQMTETLKKMNQKIKDGADISPNPPPPPPPRNRNTRSSNTRNGAASSSLNNAQNEEDDETSEDEEGEENTSSPSYYQLGLSLNSYISLFFASTDLFMSLARCFPDGVSQNLVAQQLSQVLARSLVTFAGRHSGQLKIQNEDLYKFSPRKILARLVDCLTPLTTSTSNKTFLRCLCECGVPKEDIIDAIERIISRNLVSSRHQMNLEVMRDAIISLSAEVEEEAALWEDAPDFALDALLSTPLTDPVALPTEVRDLADLVWVNRKTIHHHLLSDNHNPFNKEYLDEIMLNAYNSKPEIVAEAQEIKRKIQEWLLEAKKSAAAKKTKP